MKKKLRFTLGHGHLRKMYLHRCVISVSLPVNADLRW